MKRFTIIELMIVVAIVAILAAIAIPLFYQMQLSARSSELDTNVSAIRDAEFAYHAANDTYVAATAAAGNPSSTPLDKSLHPWVTSSAAWQALGWAPDGDVRVRYRVRTTTIACPFGSCCPPCYNQSLAVHHFCVVGESDIDDDNVIAYHSASYAYDVTKETGGSCGDISVY